MDSNSQQTPTRDKLIAAAALLQQKRLAAVNYQEARRNQSGNEDRGPPSLGTTTGAATPAAINTGRQDPNPLGEILDALGNRSGKTPDWLGRQDGPPDERHTRENSSPAGNQTLAPTQTANKEKDQNFLLQAAQMAMERGANQEAEALLQSLAAMFPEKELLHKPQKQQDTKHPTAKETQPSPPKQPDSTTPATWGEGQIKEEGGVLFIIGAIPDHSYCGLPSFYNKNAKAIKGSIMLTIFDPVWHRQAAAHHSEWKKVDRTSNNKCCYTGIPAPGEWTQSYTQWLRNY
ncbi:hypothetical protein PCASD_03908 [Puccinia coronata f. sp. avenae]|uniref:Uncharacterized protein n=1 Tax=Puccinia coronata f. sp. avenae TaxID=200324 RepID=A0A2N5VAY4_9BASI|nr:hypothetical protein PCASD_03908 [Puccinia coronata f. sp. avenae]